jgi:hypothetical protein
MGVVLSQVQIPGMEVLGANAGQGEQRLKEVLIKNGLITGIFVAALCGVAAGLSGRSWISFEETDDIQTNNVDDQGNDNSNNDVVTDDDSTYFIEHCLIESTPSSNFNFKCGVVNGLAAWGFIVLMCVNFFRGYVMWKAGVNFTKESIIYCSEVWKWTTIIFVPLIVINVLEAMWLYAFGNLIFILVFFLLGALLKNNILQGCKVHFGIIGIVQVLPINQGMLSPAQVIQMQALIQGQMMQQMMQMQQMAQMQTGAQVSFPAQPQGQPLASAAYWNPGTVAPSYPSVAAASYSQPMPFNTSIPIATQPQSQAYMQTSYSTVEHNAAKDFGWPAQQAPVHVQNELDELF